MIHQPHMTFPITEYKSNSLPMRWRNLVKKPFFFHFSLSPHMFYNFPCNNSLAIHHLAASGNQFEVSHSTAYKGYKCLKGKGIRSGAHRYKSGKSCVQYGGHIKERGVKSPSPIIVAKRKIV
ncbi:hypothetical protein H1C71_034039 [Ictidomys tridecemlineatus]|nr:hypothetical protein H1C71_034039 [Ictidomys tridecemlineatus]